MGFGTELQGRESHDALIQIQDTEIRLLENMKSCLHKRIEGDKKYIQALTSFVQTAQKIETTEYHEYCSLFKAWDTITKGTEKLAELLQFSFDGLSTKVFEKLTALINDKKATRKAYEDERNRLEKEFSRIKDEVQKNKQEYLKAVDKVKADRARYNETVSKLSDTGKGGAKLDDAKMKYFKSSLQLHKTHNKYILSLCEVKSHQENYRKKTLPCFLDYHQKIQEILVQQCKDFLEEYQRLTSCSTKDHLEVYSNIEKSVQSIAPDKEYVGEFITKHKSEPFEPIVFEFDSKILDDYQGTLVANKLALDDFTEETLTQSKTSLNTEIDELKKRLEEIQLEKKDYTARIRELNQKKNDITDEEYQESMSKKKKTEEHKKKIAETESIIATKSDLLKEVDALLSSLGGDPAPKALDLPDMTGDNMSNHGEPLSARKVFTQKLKKIHNPFKSKSPGGNDKDSVGNYEEQDGIPDHPPAGASRASQMETNNQENRLEDEDWFHGVLPREEVQRLLVNDGDFLVRESKNKRTNETQFVLSAHWQGYRHFIIQFHEGGWRFEGPCCPTIPELVRHQYQSGEPVTNKSQTILSNPIVRESWELNNDDVVLETKIGNGNFGEVFRGIYKRTNQIVAVKTCKDTLSEEQRKKFLMEGRILKQYDHPNIVKFIGIAAQRQPVMILMEYVSGGALLSFLRKDGKRQTRHQALQMCVDAASGMSYLSDKGCIHRDLAARNCLVGDKNSVKISDFGMSREEEEYVVSDGMKQIPIKWTAPEALSYGKYTTACDVWSYGILMWEVFSNGQTPYPGWTNAQARDSVEQGYRMPAPSNTPETVYKIMLKCWEYNPSTRITFKDLHKQLKALADKPPKDENWN